MIRIAEITRNLTLGVTRLFTDLDMGYLTEFTLSSGRRVDVIGINPSGMISVAEIKASIADYKNDQKWPDYLEYCDYFYFAVTSDFQLSEIPTNHRCGLIIADKYGAEILQPASFVKLSSARRKSITLRFARIASQKYQSLMKENIQTN